jgi:DNA invertase Pin-like site-specific DNA recombinase
VTIQVVSESVVVDLDPHRRAPHPHRPRTFPTRPLTLDAAHHLLRHGRRPTEPDALGLLDRERLLRALRNEPPLELSERGEHVRHCFAALMATAQKQHWALVALDCAVDTSTPSGEAMANMVAVFSQFERRLISQRTKEALAVKRASGARLGRPPTLPEGVVRRIQRARARGDSLRQIAGDLNQAGVPTAQGGARWYAATVRHVLIRTS